MTAVCEELLPFFPRNRLPADIPAAEALRPLDAVDRLIRTRLCLRHVLAERGDIQHTPAVCGDLLAVLLRPGVENLDAFNLRGVIQTFNRRPALVVARIPLRRHHHRQRRVGIPAQVEILELPIARRDQRRQEVRHQPQHQHLRLRVAEPRVVFDQLRAVLGDHQAGEQHALVGRAHRLHRPHGRKNDFVHRTLGDLVGHHRRGRIGAHAAGVRPRVAVADALVVLRRSERDGVLAVAQREERRLFALQELLDDNLGSRSPHAAAEHHVHRGFRLGERHRDDDALSGREPVRLDDDRRTLLAHVVHRGLDIAEALISAGRNVVRAAQVLGETLGALELRRVFRRPERLEARGFEIVHDPRHQRRFGSDHDEVDRFLLAESDHRRMVGDVEPDQLRLLRDPGIPRRAVELIGQWTCRNFPGQRVLTAARSEEKDVHTAEELARPAPNAPIPTQSVHRLARRKVPQVVLSESCESPPYPLL